MADDPNQQLPLDNIGPGAANVQPVNIEDEMRRSYLDYSMSVIIGRALPDIRDGLKPVHRRILYAMHDMGVLHNRKHMKCAGVVGECLKKYHPHGDSAVYDAMVRLAQPWSLRYPLIDGQGNFGSVDGDPPAAYRYTESRLTEIAEELLADIDKDTVDFVANFDDTTVEPVVLPTRIPNLLVNGSNGIAVGMATNIPPHNLTEIVDACITLVNNPHATLADMLKFVQGPDFPTGGFIHGRSGITEAYRTGRGRFMMRAKAAIEHVTKDKDAIVVTEIPYQVNKSNLIKHIAELVNNKVIDEISDVRDESDRDGMRIVIELKRGCEPQIVLNQLFKHTSMQESFSMIFLAVVNGQPKEMGLVQAIQHFVDHRIDVVRRRTAYLLMKAREREHVLEGYQVALDRVDDVIRIIRGSENRAEARTNLVEYFSGKTVNVSEGKGTQNKPATLKGAGSDYAHAPLRRGASRCDPRIATAPPDPAVDRRNPERAGGSPRTHRRVRVDSRQREEAARRHHQGTGRDQEEVRRRAPHHDSGRSRRDQPGRPDRRRAGCGDGQPLRLPEAHADLDLSPAAPRRHRPQGHEHARGGFCRAAVRRLHARLHPGLHQHRPRVLAEGVRDS